MYIYIHTHEYIHTYPSLTVQLMFIYVYMYITIYIHTHSHTYVLFIIYTNKNQSKMYLSSILIYRLKWMNFRTLSVIKLYDYEAQYIYQQFSTQTELYISNTMFSK